MKPRGEAGVLSLRRASERNKGIRRLKKWRKLRAAAQRCGRKSYALYEAPHCRPQVGQRCCSRGSRAGPEAGKSSGRATPCSEGCALSSGTEEQRAKATPPIRGQSPFQGLESETTVING